MTSHLPVEPGLVRLLAHAVGDEVAAAAAAATPPGAVATLPLTWTRAMAEHFDDADELRAWPGGQPTPPGGSASQFHAEQHFDLLAPVAMGVTLQVRTSSGRRWRRQGRSGQLEFAELVTEFLDGDRVLVRSRKVGVRLQAPASPSSEPATSLPPTPLSPGLPEQRGVPAPARRDAWRSPASVGQTYAACLTPDVTRADVARYAGVTGDVNLVHVDDAAAWAAGHPHALAHGMLTMGLTATFLTDLVGHAAVRRFGGRFSAPVLVGDRLDCSVTVTGVADGCAELAVVTTRGDGREVFTGSARVVRPDP